MICCVPAIHKEISAPRKCHVAALLFAHKPALKELLIGFMGPVTPHCDYLLTEHFGNVGKGAPQSVGKLYGSLKPFVRVVDC